MKILKIKYYIIIFLPLKTKKYLIFFFIGIILFCLKYMY